MPRQRIESLGETWAVYSSVSGETRLINDESAALLEWLVEICQTADTTMAAEFFAPLTGLEVDMLRERIEPAWAPLLEAGLIRLAEP